MHRNVNRISLKITAGFDFQVESRLIETQIAQQLP
jgi:hypothetical protein